jgi:hypothetical protein
MADGPLCKKHNVARVATQTGRKKLWVLACPKCAAEKAGGPPSPPATPPAATPPAAPAPPTPEKKTVRYEKGLFYSRRIEE